MAAWFELFEILQNFNITLTREPKFDIYQAFDKLYLNLLNFNYNQGHFTFANEVHSFSTYHIINRHNKLFHVFESLQELLNELFDTNKQFNEEQMFQIELMLLGKKEHYEDFSDLISHKQELVKDLFKLETMLVNMLQLNPSMNIEKYI